MADTLAGQIAEDYRTADIQTTDRVLLDYAAKLTRQPSEMVPADIDPLRQQGWDDRAIHDLCAIVSYFAFANRIASGLGIELESG